MFQSVQPIIYERFAYFEPLKCHEYFIYCENSFSPSLSVKTYSKLFTMAEATRRMVMNHDYYGLTLFCLMSKSSFE